MNNNFRIELRTVANGWIVELTVGSYGQPGYRNENYSFNIREEMLMFMQEHLLEAPQSNLGAVGDQW